jgi:hypothetical protein
VLLDGRWVAITGWQFGWDAAPQRDALNQDDAGG